MPPAELVGAYGFPAVFCASLALSSPPAVADVKNPLHHVWHHSVDIRVTGIDTIDMCGSGLPGCEENLMV